MTERMGIDRRQFLKKSAAGVLGAGLIGPGGGTLPRGTAGRAPLKIKEYRVLGRTGFKVSDISLGCSRGTPLRLARPLCLLCHV